MSNKKTHCQLALEAFHRGEKLTRLDALNKFGCLSLNSRVSDLRRDGHVIASKMIMTDTGKMVKLYWINNEDIKK